MRKIYQLKLNLIKDWQNLGTLRGIILTIGSISAIVAAVIRTNLIAKIHGPIGIGLLTSLSALLTFLTTFSSGGMNNSFIKALSKHEGSDLLSTASKETSLLFINILLCLPWIFFLLLFPRYISQALFVSDQFYPIIPIMALGLIGLVIFNTTQTVLAARNKQHLIVIMQVIIAFITVISTLLFYKLKYQWGVLLMLIFPNFISAFSPLILKVFSLSEMKKMKFKILFSEFLDSIQLSSIFFLTAILETFLLLWVISKIGVYGGLKGVGIWGVSFALAGIGVNSVLLSMSYDFYPKIVSIIKSGVDPIQPTAVQIKNNLLIGSAFLLPIVAFPDEVIELFYSGNFFEAKPPLFILQISFIIKLIGNTLIYIPLARGFNLRFGQMIFIPQVILFLAVLFLVPLFGALGAAVSFLFSSAIGFFLAITFQDSYRVLSYISKEILLLLFVFFMLCILDFLQPFLKFVSVIMLLKAVAILVYSIRFVYKAFKK
jgi:O-antigen/teichoic acid export membrane protein